MNNLFLTLITFVIFYISFFIGYQLALVFIGFSIPMKRVLLQILLFSVIGYISKIGLNAPALTHGVIVIIVCAGLLYLFNKINIILSLIGSLLSYTTLTLGSLLLACPVFIKLGYAVPLKFNGIAWLFLNLLELIVPTLVLVIIKTTKFSLMKYIYTTR